MRNLFTACGGAILAAALAMPAAAQVTGTYAGTSADGVGLSFVVSTDSANGDPELTAAGIGFSAPCKNSTVVLNTGWGIGLGSDIVKHKVKFVSAGSYFTFTVSLVFSNDGQSATGTIDSISPTLDPVGAKPKKALFCESPTQSLTLALQAPTARAVPPARGATVYDRLGRPIGQIQR